MNHPPILLDIGAAGEIHHKWKQIAGYSICIAFDADEREMGYVAKESSGYKKLYVYNCIVSDKATGTTDFYLTRSPQCSSLLKPKQESLNNWIFADLFDVEKITTLKTIALPEALKEVGIQKIDWFKVDSQGTDLRLFDSLGGECINKVLIAEFEPGIIDAYEGEDKLWALMAYMEKRPFWMADITIRGSQRISRKILSEKFNRFWKMFVPKVLKTSPGWAEVTYLNTFKVSNTSLDKRDFLLGWIFATLEKQYGFALEIARNGFQIHADPIFIELEGYAQRSLRRSYSMIFITILKGLASKLFALLKNI